MVKITDRSVTVFQLKEMFFLQILATKIAIYIIRKNHFGLIPCLIYKKIHKVHPMSWIFLKFCIHMLLANMSLIKKNYHSIMFRSRVMLFKRIYLRNTVLLYAWLIVNYFTLFLIDFDKTNMYLGVLDHTKFIFYT